MARSVPQNASQSGTNWKAKYTHVVHKLAKDYEVRVEANRKDANLAQKKSEVYIEELKLQLERSKKQVKELEKRLSREMEAPSSSSKRLMRKRKAQSNSDVGPGLKEQLLELMTCLNIIVVVNNDTHTVYQCTLDDGELNGHEFQLSFSKTDWEYTYEPIQRSPTLSDDDDLAQKLCFPDYMISRFLTKLLTATYCSATDQQE